MNNGNFEKIDKELFKKIYDKVYAQEIMNTKSKLKSDESMCKEIQSIIEGELKNVIEKN